MSNLLTVAFNNFTYQGGSTPGNYAPAIVSPTMVIANDGTDSATMTVATLNLSGVRCFDSAHGFTTYLHAWAAYMPPLRPRRAPMPHCARAFM